jgi:hypothetical protein
LLQVVEIKRLQIRARKLLTATHDAVATTLAVLVNLCLRFEGG